MLRELNCVIIESTVLLKRTFSTKLQRFLTGELCNRWVVQVIVTCIIWWHVYRYHSSCHSSRLSTASSRRLGAHLLAAIVSRRRSYSPGVSRRQARSVRPSSQGPGSRGLTRRHLASAVGQAGSRMSPPGLCKSINVCFWHRLSTLDIIYYSNKTPFINT